jgi:hypothetical protein
VGVLTVSMTGLRDAIVSSREARMELLGDLARQTGERRMGVSTLCAGFARDRAGAHRAWFGPLLFESPAAARHQHAANAKAPAQEQPRATPKAEQPRHKPAHKPVAARAAEPSGAPLPRAKKRSFKGPKKH